MSTNTLPTSSEIVAEALRRFKNTAAFLKTVNRQYNPAFKSNGTEKGVTVNVRKPVYLRGRRGSEAQIEGIEQRLVPVTIDTQYGADIAITSQEKALNFHSYSEQVIQPAIDRIVNDIEVDGLLLAAQKVSNFVGTPGTTPNAFLTYAAAGGRLSDNGVPKGRDRYSAVNPTFGYTLVDALKGLFNSQDTIGKQNMEATMGRTAGLTFIEDQNMPTHTVGALGGTPLVNGANQTGSSIVTDGWTASVTGVLKKGDIITFASVNAVNPSSRINTGQLRQFVVTADVNSNGSGQATIPIYPPLDPNETDPYRTVTQSPADNAVILIFGHASSFASVSSPQGLVYWKDFITFVNVDLYVPTGLEMGGGVSSEDLNLSIRHIRFFDGIKDKLIDRFDVLGGWTVTRPEAGVRVMG